MSKETMKLALVALMRSRKAVSGDLDLAGCAYGKNDPDGHRYADAKTTLVTLDKAISALREVLAEQPAQQEPVGDITCWTVKGHLKNTDFDYYGNLSDGTHLLYTSPPAQRKPLTDEQWQEIAAITGCLRIEKRGRDAILRVFEEAAHGIEENT